MRERLKMFVDSLPEKCREIFILACIEGLKYKQVAEKLDVSVNTVKTQLKSAYSKLRAEFNENDLEEIRNKNEQYLMDDVSIIVARNKKNNSGIFVCDMLEWTDHNILNVLGRFPKELLTFLDPSIEYLECSLNDKKVDIRLKFYGKEEIKDFAIKHSLVGNYNDTDKLYNDFLSLEANGDSIIKQANVIKEIANAESCVIVGRSADYILRDNKNLIKIFLYAPEQYKIETIKRLYNDNDSTAKSYIKKSDKARSTYYEVISNQIWGNKNNYDICLDCQIGNDEIVKIICNYVKNKMKN